MSTPSAQDQPLRGHLTLRYWAAARAAVGTAEEQVVLDGPVALAALVEEIVLRHGGSERLRALLSTCSVLVGDRPVGSADPATVLVEAGQSVEFLPPFAGG